jgi:hypothetical protein
VTLAGGFVLFNKTGFITGRRALKLDRVFSIMESYMSRSDEYEEQLAHVLEQQRNHLETNRIPKMKELFRIYHTSLQSITGILIRKGLLQEDPYKGEHRISEITVPDNTNFLDSEKDEQMTIRLSQFDSQLDFLNNFQEFTLDSLNLRQIKTLSELTKYIKWNQLTETSTHMLTRSLAQSIGKLNSGADPLSGNIVSNAHKEILTAAGEILSVLKDITAYKKELYKYELRRDVLSGIKIPAGTYPAREADLLKAIKKRFTQTHPGKPFLQDLVKEVLAEDNTAEGNAARQEILESLSIKEEKKKTGPTRNQHREMLIEAARIMATAGRPMSTILQKLQENKEILDTRSLTLTQKILAWMENISGKEQKPELITLEYLDETTSARQTEKLDFNVFCEQTARRNRTLGGIQNKMGSTWKKIQEANEEQLFEFLRKTLEDLYLTHRRMASIDTYFQAEAPREDRKKLRGIQTELASMKDIIVRANKKRHDYVARKEEMEQLRKLGVTTEDT